MNRSSGTSMFAVLIVVAPAINSSFAGVVCNPPNSTINCFQFDNKLGGSVVYGIGWPLNATIIIGCDDGTGLDRREKEIQTDPNDPRGIFTLPGGLNGWAFLKDFYSPLGCSVRCDAHVKGPPPGPLTRVEGLSGTGWVLGGYIIDKVFKYVLPLVGAGWILAEVSVEPGANVAVAEYVPGTDLRLLLSSNSSFSQMPTVSHGQGIVLGTPVLSDSNRVLTVPVISNATGPDDLSLELVMIDVAPASVKDLAVVNVEATMRFVRADGTFGDPELVATPFAFLFFEATGACCIPPSSCTLDVTPDECTELHGIYQGDDTQTCAVDEQGVCVPPPLSPIADPTGYVKSRFISFSVPGNPGQGQVTALRVKLTSLHHVIPPYTVGASIPFTLFEGQSLFVGPPLPYVESTSTATPFLASTLRCTAHYRDDWGTVGLLHVTGEAIMPSSSYDIENLAAACLGQETTPPCLSGGGNVSAALTIVTARSGDVIIDGVANFADISALVSKFQSKPGAPIKARSKMAGSNARGLINIVSNLGFGDISVDVDGFQGKPYPFKPGKCTGAPTTPCKDNTECGANGPCILCP